MTVFFIVAALLVAAALLFVVPPLLRGENSAAAGGTRRDLNITIYQDQMRELERDLEADVITREQYAQGREELERRMLDDVETPEGAAARPARANRSTLISAVVVAGLLPVLAAGLYMHFGAPAALDPDRRAAGAAGMAGHGSEAELQAQIAGMVASLRSVWPPIPRTARAGDARPQLSVDGAHRSGGRRARKSRGLQRP